MDDKLELARSKSIVDYLHSRGIETQKSGGKYFCSSPFSRDTNWSFCIYPSNTYFDWSTGAHGDIIDLVQKIELCDFKTALNHLVDGDYRPIRPNYKQYRNNEKVYQDFDISKFINNNPQEREQIKEYANGRGITEGFEYGIFFTRDGDSWVRNPSLMFPHVDNNLKLCGAKFRKVNNFSIKDGSNNVRFSARGRQCFYILENLIEDSFDDPVLYLVESESSANSLWMYCRELKRNCVVISFGGVSSAPSTIPDRYKDFELKIIIDYDGNEKLYNERLKLYKHLNGTHIKLMLPKGEDLNSLYNNKTINLINNLL